MARYTETLPPSLGDGRTLVNRRGNAVLLSIGNTVWLNKNSTGSPSSLDPFFAMLKRLSAINSRGIQ
jgi:hypothetical protein